MTFFTGCYQMDFKRPTGWEQRVGPLSVLDDPSRYLIALAQTDTTCGQAVRERLEQGFTECGLPEAMLMDHGGAVVEWGNGERVDGVDGVVDAVWHPAELRALSASAGQSGAVSWGAGDGAAARVAAAGATAELAG